MAGRDFKPDRQAERIYGGVNLGRQPAAGVPDGASFKPPF